MRTNLLVHVLALAPGAALALVLVAPPATAQVCDGSSTTTCPPAPAGAVTRDAAAGALAEPDGQPRDSAVADRQLPFSGGDLVQALIAAGATIAAGGAFYAAGRQAPAVTGDLGARRWT